MATEEKGAGDELASIHVFRSLDLVFRSLDLVHECVFIPNMANMTMTRRESYFFSDDGKTEVISFIGLSNEIE
jgi:hypothetical protein